MQQMNEAFRQAIAAYWEGKEPAKTKKEMKGRFKYDKSYFDSKEESELGSVTEADSWDGIKK